MSGSTSSISRRSRQRRVIVVGDADVFEQMARVLDRPLTLARSTFDVIGELATSTLGCGPDAIIVSLHTIGSAAPRLAESIRALDPVVTMIGLLDASDPVNHGLSEGFDVLVTTDVDREILEDAIAGLTVGPLAGQAPQTDEGSPSAAADDSTGSLLGDVDLVRAIASGEGSVARVAARIIEQETGWPSVVVLDEESAGGESDAECEAVMDGSEGAVLGYLTVRGRADIAAEELRSWARWLAPWMRLAREHAELRSQAHTDDLTGSFNRRHFESIVPGLLADAHQRRQCVSVLLFDVDDFKRYNERYGHAAGDEILIETVRLLRSVVRPHDHVCRIGGDEFVVVFHDPEGKRDAASDHPRDIQGIARRFQQQIAQHRFPKLSHEAPGELTISGGIATYPWDGVDTDSLLAHADRNLFASKRAGKNAITFGPGIDEAESERSDPG